MMFPQFLARGPKQVVFNLLKNVPANDHSDGNPWTI
jgi:hypothetical protein